MSTKFNLHAHSHYSDGDNSIYEMVKTYKEAGFSFACLTDHDYSLLGSRGPYEHRKKRAVERFHMARGAAREVSQLLDFPVIIGLELSFYHDEMIMFGTDAIVKWLAGDNLLASEAILSKQEEAFKGLSFLEEDHALIVVHPSFGGPQWMYSIAHGYETHNRGRFFKNADEKAALMGVPKNQFYGIDAHSSEDLIALKDHCHDIDTDIRYDFDLADWIKSRRT